LRFEDKDKDKDMSLKDEDKDNDLKIGPRGSSRTRIFLEDNNTGSGPHNLYLGYQMDMIFLSTVIGQRNRLQRNREQTLASASSSLITRFTDTLIGRLVSNTVSIDITLGVDTWIHFT